MVAGAAALVWGKTPSLTRDQVVDKLVSTGETTSCGFAAPTPRLDVRKALLGTSETAIIGRLLDPATGDAAANTQPIAKLYSGSTLLKSDTANESGFYEMKGLTAGTGRTLKATGGSGYVNANVRKGISIVSGAVAGPSTDALPQARATGNATVTIDWKTLQPIFDLSFPQFLGVPSGCADTCNGWEFDLRLKHSDTSYVFASRNSTGDLNKLDPVETVVLGSEAANGTYKVIANNKSPDTGGTQWNPSWNGSQASVQMYNGAASLGGGLKAVPPNCGTNQFWYVGDLTKTGTSYAWENKNVCTNTEPS
jgi:hypothetical protein